MLAEEVRPRHGRGGQCLTVLWGPQALGSWVKKKECGLYLPGAGSGSLEEVGQCGGMCTGR